MCVLVKWCRDWDIVFFLTCAPRFALMSWCIGHCCASLFSPVCLYVSVCVCVTNQTAGLRCWCYSQLATLTEKMTHHGHEDVCGQLCVVRVRLYVCVRSEHGLWVYASLLYSLVCDFSSSLFAWYKSWRTFQLLSPLSWLTEGETGSPLTRWR